METPDGQIETAKLISGDPKGRDHIYLGRKDPGFRAGIWRSSPYTEWYDSYPCDEFMVVLEGSVTLEGEGFSETYRKGDAFLMPRGFKGYWKQEEPMLKYYVIVE
jgi:uncharacterized protein